MNFSIFFSSRPQSEPHQLIAGKLYYFEGIFTEHKGDSFLSVGVILPDGTKALPITSNYLKRYE